MFSVFSRFLAVFQVQEVDRKVEEIKVPILPARRCVFLLLRRTRSSFISKGGGVEQYIRTNPFPIVNDNFFDCPNVVSAGPYKVQIHQ